MTRMVVLSLTLFVSLANADEKSDFWNTQRVGANGDGVDATQQWFQSAAEAGIEYVRLSVAEMPPTERDFLIGNADRWKKIPDQDLRKLITVLDRAETSGVKVVITMFSLPGCRWKQKNNDQFDYRLWHDDSFQQDAADFWQELAKHLREHPAVVGYNVLNEPAPEREHGFEGPSPAFTRWQQETQGHTADLNRFYRRVVRAIRSVDRMTPIILDGCFHASPAGLETLMPVDDPATLYSFHFYQPWHYTTFRVNQGRFRYPDQMPVDWEGKSKVVWTGDEWDSRMSPVVRWATAHNVPANRILAGEFGCDRRVSGAAAYLDDTIQTLNRHQWHWAFYSYRSGTWDGMDYELGTKSLGPGYWQAQESGQSHEELIERRPNPLWNVLSKHLGNHRNTTAAK